MDFELTKAKADTIEATLLVVGTKTAKPKKGTSLGRLDGQLKEMIGRTLKQEGFEGKEGESRLIRLPEGLSQRALLILGAQAEQKGDLPVNGLEQLRRVAASATQAAKEVKAKMLVFDLASWPVSRGFSEVEGVQALVEGVHLASYRFRRYLKKSDQKSPLKKVCLATARIQAAHRKGVEQGQAGAEGTCLARDLVNTPACDMAPQDLARVAKKLPSPIRVRVYSEKEIEQMKMGSYLSVGHGSQHPPALIHMSYRPRGKNRGTVALVGKGVTFDSGGLSLKPPGSMETMKDDMAGAAAVIGTMQAVAQLRPKVAVHAVVAAVENMPSGSATKPGDIVTAMNGKTIEILNTDAEGRLTLADALAFAQQKKPEVMIDLATLTGACLVALGERCSGLMGNNTGLLKAIRKSAERTGERVWPLPLIDEYNEDLKTPIADIKNIGGRWGGTIEAGLFLQAFVDKTRWAHLDIAGPSWASKDFPYEPKGGTGAMVRTLLDFLLHY